VKQKVNFCRIVSKANSKTIASPNKIAANGVAGAITINRNQKKYHKNNVFCFYCAPTAKQKMMGNTITKYAAIS
jgi:hypothetical protein